MTNDQRPIYKIQQHPDLESGMNELRTKRSANINTTVLQVVAAILTVILYIVRRRRSKIAIASIELVGIILGLGSH